VIRDDAVGHDVRVAHSVRLAGQLLDAANDRHEQVGLVIGLLVLQHTDDALQPQAGVDARRGQRLVPLAGVVGIGLEPVELHEHEVPQFQEPVALGLQRRDDRVDTFFRAQIPMDLAGRAAGAGLRHLPEVGLRAQPGDPPRIHADILGPDGIGFFVALVDGEAQPLDRDFVHLGYQIIGEADRVAFEVVAEAEVAEHLKEGVVARRGPHVFEIVVLAADPHALLRRGGAAVRALVQPEEDVLELDHPGVGE